MGGIVTQRSMGSSKTNVVEVYPSASGIANRNNSERFSASGYVPASEADTRAGNCAQCGAPYEDHAILAECPECGSDNFRGKSL